MLGFKYFVLSRYDAKMLVGPPPPSLGRTHHELHGTPHSFRHALPDLRRRPGLAEPLGEFPHLGHSDDDDEEEDGGAPPDKNLPVGFGAVDAASTHASTGGRSSGADLTDRPTDAGCEAGPLLLMVGDSGEEEGDDGGGGDVETRRRGHNDSEMFHSNSLPLVSPRRGGGKG